MQEAVSFIGAPLSAMRGGVMIEAVVCAKLIIPGARSVLL
jgi:hypothetical protein